MPTVFGIAPPQAPGDRGDCPDRRTSAVRQETDLTSQHLQPIKPQLRYHSSDMRVQVRPELLRWARERAGLSLDVLARRIPQLPA